MSNKKAAYLIISLIVVLALLAGVARYASHELSPSGTATSTATTSTATSTAALTSFEECAAAGYPIMESYPSRCTDGSGKTHTQYIGNELEKMDLIIIDSPRPNQLITSPLSITGNARGPWYFEASFPVALFDATGNLIAQGPAQAKGGWMTTEFVPFSMTLTFPKQPAGSHGTLKLGKDNPSGLPENDDALIVPVRF